MGDPRAVVPYHDPHDPSSSYTAEQLLLHEFQNDQNPTLSDIYNPLSTDPNPNFPSSSSDYYGRFQRSGEGIGPGDPTSKTFHNPTVGSTGFGSSSYIPSDPARPGGSNGGAGPSSYNENLNFENTKPLPIWPEPPSPYSCSFCHVLREILHTNGNHTTRLELHGRLGMICHAILENRHSDHFNPPGHRYQMFDFCKRSIEDVKQFLRQYCEEKSQAGFELMPDPLSIYYEAVCIGLVWDDIIFDDADYYFESSPRGPEEVRNGPPDPPPIDQQSEPVRNNQAERNMRTFLALQVTFIFPLKLLLVSLTYARLSLKGSAGGVDSKGGHIERSGASRGRSRNSAQS